MDLVSELRFTDSFSFKYSPRPGTPAVRRGLPPVPAEEAQARLLELQGLQRELTLAAHQARVGESVAVLVEGRSRRGGGQQQGRCPQNRIVNFSSERPLAPGFLTTLRITGASPHSLLGTPLSRAGAWELPLV